MTIGEFKAWLEGYLAAGGNDVNEVAEKAKGLVSEMTFAPRYPNESAPFYPGPSPISPAIPNTNPYRPFPIVTCSSVGADVEAQSWNA